MAPVRVLDGGAPEATVAVDQKVAPDDYDIQGTAWEDFGTYTVDSGALSVRLSNLATGTVVADGVRVFKVASPAVVVGASLIPAGIPFAQELKTGAAEPTRATVTASPVPPSAPDRPAAAADPRPAADLPSAGRESMSSPAFEGDSSA